jgi:proline iminopeptidase
MEDVREDFAPLTKDHVVIFYDQRGGGRSELPSDTTRLFGARQVQDLEEVRRFFSFRRMTLVAHSYGPLLAVSYAVAHPRAVARLVFFGGVGPRLGDLWQRFDRAFSERLDSTQRSQLADADRRMADPASDFHQACWDYQSIALRPRFANPHLVPALIRRNEPCAGDLASLRYGANVSSRVILASFGDWDLRAQLRSLDMPALIVHGEAELIPLDLAAEWAAALPRGRLLPAPRAGHMPCLERGDVVWPAVEKFLRETTP